MRGHLRLVPPIVHYEIIGELYRGDETPRFRAELRANDSTIAKLLSDGRGGCAVIEWAGISADTRSAAAKWLSDEALRCWPAEYGVPPTSLLRLPEEAAILVVPERIGAPMSARYSISSARRVETWDLRELLASNVDEGTRRSLRSLRVGESCSRSSLTITRIS